MPYQRSMNIQVVTTLQHFIKTIKFKQKHQKYLDVFSSLGDTSLKETCIKSNEEFTCDLYGYSKIKNIHQVIKYEG